MAFYSDSLAGPFEEQKTTGSLDPVDQIARLADFCFGMKASTFDCLKLLAACLSSKPLFLQFLVHE